MKEGAAHSLNIIVKADVQGSVEALRDSLSQLSTDEVKVNVIAAAAGGISETDANLAVASNAIVVGFNVRADAAARRVIEAEMVDLRYFSVIYEVIDTVKQAMSGMLAPEFKEEIVGIAEVRDVFRSKRFGNIAGCRVSEGTVRRSNPIRVLRDSVVIYEGELESLRRFQDDVNEVPRGNRVRNRGPQLQRRQGRRSDRSLRAHRASAHAVSRRAARCDSNGKHRIQSIDASGGPDSARNRAARGPGGGRPQSG